MPLPPRRLSLPARPPHVPVVTHALRAVGWMALLELIAGASLVGVVNAGGLGGWLLAAALAYGVAGLLLGLALGRVPGLRARPPLACALIGLILAGGAALVDGGIVWASTIPALIGGTFAWSRWRFPGQPSRKRAVFRGVFFAWLAGSLLWLGGRPLAPWRFVADSPDAPHAQGPSVMVVVLDTVGRNHLSTYGYPRDTAPTLDALGARGAIYPGFANACWSLPGHASALTGLYAGSHGAHYEGGALAEAATTLPAVFEAAGYDTLGISGNPWLNRGNGTAADFGALIESWSRYLIPEAFAGMRAIRPLWDRDGDKGGMSGARSLADWLDARPQADRPFFAMVNVMEAHAPYHQVHPDDAGRYLPEGAMSPDEAERLSEALLQHHLMGSGAPTGDDVQRAKDLYDGAIRGADRVLAALLGALETRDLLDDTVVIVTSDHGEYLGEHGLWGHVHGLFEPVVQIPMVIAGPGVAPGRFDAPARLIDVPPTALELAGVPRDAWPAMHGRPLSEGRAGDPVIAEQYVPVLLTGRSGAHLGDDLEQFRVRRRSALAGDWKLHVREGGDEGRDDVLGLYDVAADPGESVDQQGAAPSALIAAEGALSEWAATTGIEWPDEVGAGPQVGAWEGKALEALGYVE